MNPLVGQLLDAASRPYAAAGRYAWHFARGKLRFDPVFLGLLRRGLLPDRGRLLDLGCGQGLLLSLLLAARDEHAAGRWPPGWPAPPRRLELSGIDSHPGRVRAARAALGARACVEQRDLRAQSFSQSCSAVVILDVLLYLRHDEQERLLDAAAQALEPNGMLLMREADARDGLAFRLTQFSAWLDSAARGRFREPMGWRSASRWVEALAKRGFAVETMPMSEGTPYANVLFVGRKEAA